MSHRTIFRALAALLVLGGVASAADDPGWPRTYEKDGQTVVVHQPQVDEWPDYKRIAFRAAVAVTLRAGEQPAYGVVEVNAETRTDHAARTVVFIAPQVEVRFPNMDEKQAEQLERVVKGVLPELGYMVVSLDRVLTCLDPKKSAARAVNVNLDPPTIHYSATPAVLVMYMGAPRFKPVKGTGLMFAVNTNWDVFLDQATSTYFLLNGTSWLSAPDPEKGPWMAARQTPADLAKLPNDANWEDVLKAIPGQPGGVVKVITGTGPAELILTEGEPQYGAVPGTKLMYVTNTDSDLFLHTGEHQFYYLVAGRWFRAKELAGPWSAASQNLPDDFSKIPDDHEMADVLASVPGTDDAKDAVLLASVPQTATVNRNEVSVTVEYGGTPKFEPIQGTKVQYAVNTSYDVVLVSGGYYCCHQGVWFAAPKATGPWVVCTTVPPEVYTIPVTHPKHNVTYVHVYDSTPETVVVGHSGGYSGQYVAATGVLMFGAGLLVGAALDDDDDWYHVHYGSSFYSYGCGAHYSYAYGGYYRAAHCYGPYGGAGRAAAYNPHTGTYSRGAYRYGPSGGAFAREAYNPHTNTYAARAGASTPYGSWSRGVFARDDDWVRGGRASNARGTAGWVETSGGRSAVGARGNQGGAVVAGSEGNVYAGKDGNVYKRNDSGDWQRYGGGGSWDSVNRPTPRDAGARGGQATAHDRSAGSGSDTRRQLDNDARARQRGNAQQSRVASSRAGGGAGSRGAGGSRGGGASRGGGSGRGGGGRGR